MTSEHCGHECVCNLYLNECWYGHLLADKSLPCDMKGVLTKPCEHDTRTHSAAEPVPAEDCDRCRFVKGCTPLYVPPCYNGAAVKAAKQAREKVLDEALAEFQNINAPPVRVTYIRHVLESLRQQEQKP